jgi:hypothetical protein
MNTAQGKVAFVTGATEAGAPLGSGQAELGEKAMRLAEECGVSP